MDLTPYIQRVESQMQEMIQVSHPVLEPFYGMMNYHLGWMDKDLQPAKLASGKRFRPLLCLLTCQAVGGDVEQAVPAAAALELIHNFSLIHDDIEDASPLRRHRETIWHIWGVPQAINVGDGMLMLSHLALQPLRDRGIEPTMVLDIIKLLDETCLRLCQGQYLDLAFEERESVTVEEYLLMIGGKTASLVAASTQIGAMVVTEDAAIVDQARVFGRELGLAFQMVDDILGIWGDPDVTGKSAASDILSRKKTLPILYAWEELERGEAEDRLLSTRLHEMYGRASGEPPVHQVLEILEQAGARDYVQERATMHTEKALAALRSAAEPSTVTEQLEMMATSFLERTF